MPSPSAANTRELAQRRARSAQISGTYNEWHEDPRLARIITVALRFGLDDILLAHERLRGSALGHRILFWRDLSRPRAVRLRLALETLGPIFVKFGQVLSTRRDLLPPDIADELAKLQDRRAAVPRRGR